MELGPALLPGPPELGMMSSRVPSLVCERLRVPSLVCERLRAPSRDVTLEPDAVRDLIKRVMLAEGTGERGESPVRDWAKAGDACTSATQPAACPACLWKLCSCSSSRPSRHWAPLHFCAHLKR